MTSYRAPFQLPTYSGEDQDEFSKDIQAPPIVKVDVILGNDWDNSLGDDPYLAAQDVLANYYAKLNTFFRAQQQNYNAGQGGFWKKVESFGPVLAHYSNSQGTEIMHLHVVVTNSGGTTQGAIETNLDGYIAWLFTGDPGGVQYSFDLNGVNIYSCSSPAQNSVVIFKIGSTATLCQSLANKDSKDFPLATGNPNKNLLAAVLPPRKRTEDFNTVPDQYYFTEHEIGPHDDLFVYPMYYYGNYLAQAGGYGSTLPDNGDVYLPLGEPTIGTVIKVDATYLNENQVNKFRVSVTPDKGFLPLKGGGAIVFAEFYSRQEHREVIQSWTQVNDDGITVNDTPLAFAMSVPYYKTQALDFDLSIKKVDRTTPTPHPAFWNPNTLQTISTDSAYANGYWRPGDGINVQNPPDSTGPWYWALQAARQAVLGWQYATQTMLLFRIEDEYISGEYYWAFPATEQAYNSADESLTTADETVTSALSAYDDDGVYGDHGATASMANSITQVDDAYNSIDTTSSFVTSLAGYQIDNPAQFDDEFVTTQRQAANLQIQALDDDLILLLKNINSYPNL